MYEEKTRIEENEYEIVSFKKIHISKIRDLYNKSYNKNKSLKIFNYKLNESPYGKPIGYLMKYKKIIVGFYVITPIIVKINCKNILGGMSFLTMTHPDHQRKGIFTKLAKKTFSTAKKKGYKFIFGYSANKNSIDGFKKLGFTHNTIYYYELNKKNKLSKKYLKSLTNNFPNGIDSLLEECKETKQNKIQLLKNKKFLQWRFEKNPTNYLTVYKENQYFIIFKKFDNILHIIDFFSKSNNFKEILIKTAIQEAKRLKCDKITTWTPKITNQKINNKNSLKKKKSPNYFVIKKLDSKLNSDILELKNWHYTMTNSDIF